MAASTRRRRPWRRRPVEWRGAGAARERELEARERAVAAAERALAERHDAFLRAVAHQLRTPLATLLVASDALRPEHGELPPAERDELVDVLIRQVARLRALTEDVVALVDPAAALAPTEVVTPVGGILGSLAVQYLPNRQVEVVAADDVALDAAHVLRLLAPLLRNVADHTPVDAPVRLRAGRHPQLPGTVQLTVEDGGPGLDRGTGPDGDLTIVEAFRQGEEAARRPSPGLGLGLAVVDALARAGGGSLVLGRSELGGLAATVLLPGDVSGGG